MFFRAISVFVGGIDADERKRIEYQNLQIEVHRRVLRENHRRQNEAAESDDEHQQCLETPHKLKF